MADPAFYRQSGEDVTAAQTRLEQIDNDLEQAYARWEELGEIAETQ